MQKLKVWVGAARLRTLPLSISGIIVGTSLASFHGYYNITIFVLALLTTIGFQITSNLANDYGDGKKGTDNEQRVGPKRAYQSGLLSPTELKRGIIISVVINFLLVIAVLYFSFGSHDLWYILVFALLGVASIWAAIKYTVGTSAYGYRGLGDVFVFLFFGFLGVLGSMFLFTKFLTLSALLPATAIGLLSTGVLNLNNLRDYESDRNAKKNTLIVKMGFNNGKKYHFALLITSFLCMLTYVLVYYFHWKNFISLLAFVPIFVHMHQVKSIKTPSLLDPELKKLALSTFLLAVLFYFSYNNFL